MPKHIRTDDGTILEVKEPSVLNADGAVVSEPESSRENFRSSTGPKIHVWRGGWIFSVFLIVLVPLLAAAGFTVLGIFLVVTIALWTLKGFFRFLSGSSR